APAAGTVSITMAPTMNPPPTEPAAAPPVADGDAALPIATPIPSDTDAGTAHTIPMASDVALAQAPPTIAPTLTLPETPSTMTQATPAPMEAAATAISAKAPESERLPAGARPKLVVLRGVKLNVEYPLYEGANFIGRADEKPVDIDLED